MSDKPKRLSEEELVHKAHPNCEMGRRESELFDHIAAVEAENSRLDEKLQRIGDEWNHARSDFAKVIKIANKQIDAMRPVVEAAHEYNVAHKAYATSKPDAPNIGNLHFQMSSAAEQLWTADETYQKGGDADGSD